MLERLNREVNKAIDLKVSLPRYNYLHDYAEDVFDYIFPIEKRNDFLLCWSGDHSAWIDHKTPSELW